jgi:hypothetical protein
MVEEGLCVLKQIHLEFCPGRKLSNHTKKHTSDKYDYLGRVARAILDAHGFQNHHNVSLVFM